MLEVRTEEVYGGWRGDGWSPWQPLVFVPIVCGMLRGGRGGQWSLVTGAERRVAVDTGTGDRGQGVIRG